LEPVTIVKDIYLRSGEVGRSKIVIKNQMPKLLFTATYAQPYLSGITDYIAKVTEYLTKFHQVSLLVFQHQSQLPNHETRHQVQIHRLKPQLKLSKGLINWAYPLEAWRAVAAHDQILINLPQVESIWVALAAKLLGKKLAVIYHCELVFETGWGNQILAMVANILASWVGFLADTIIVYTQDYADHSPILKPYSQKIQAVLPPVDLIPFDRTLNQKFKTLIGEITPIIGFSGRISREKGLKYLLPALVKLRQKYPQIQLFLAGPFGSEVVGEENYFAKLQNQIAIDHLPVTFLGRLTKAELGAFYRHLDLLILPSTNRTEAFGLVQAEALLIGTPVITTDLPGVRMAVKLTGGGVVVPIKDSIELVRAVTQILQHPTEFAAKKISVRAQQIFDSQKTLTWYRNFCDSAKT